MNRPAPSPNVSKEEVYRLAVAVIEDDVSDAEAQRFESLIAADPTARGWYVDLICDACSLRRLNRDQGSCAALPNKDDSAQASEPTGSAPVLGFLGQPRTVPWSYFSSGWPLAYLVATVIFGLGLLVGSLVPVSRTGSRSPSNLPLSLSSSLSAVESSAGSPAWSIASGTEPRKSQAQDPRLQDPIRCLSWRHIRPGLRPDGNHLRHRSQGHLAGTGDI